MNSIFFIPYYFSIKTHYQSPKKIAVYFITYLIPELIILFLQRYYFIKPSLEFFIVYIIGMTSFVNLYEIGYIWNETETIKNEENPTKRLTDKNLFFYENRKILIYAERILSSIILNIFLSFFITSYSLFAFICSQLLMLVTFFIYNNIRGNMTQLVYFFLCVLKYISITMCYFEYLTTSVVLATIFVFPFVRTFEYKAHYNLESNINLVFRKYIIKYNVNRITDFRFYCTGIIFMIFWLLYFIKITNLIPVVASGYIFVYRMILFIIVNAGVKIKGYISR